MRLCTAPECRRPHYSRGLCRFHYQRLRRHGDPLGQAIGKARHYFENVVLADEGDGCLLWPYAALGGGGVLQHHGRLQFVHRLACEATHGPAPSSDHDAVRTCGNRLCVAKRHLKWSPRIAQKVTHSHLKIFEQSTL
jgi:hypothetical protein